MLSGYRLLLAPRQETCWFIWKTSRRAPAKPSRSLKLIACGCRLYAGWLTKSSDRFCYHGVSIQVSCWQPYQRCQPQLRSIPQEQTCSPHRGVFPLFLLRFFPSEDCSPEMIEDAGGGTLLKSTDGMLAMLVGPDESLCCLILNLLWVGWGAKASCFDFPFFRWLDMKAGDARQWEPPQYAWR
jgi:hypothetical protein